MNLKDIAKVKIAKNLKMGAERVYAGETFDVSKDMPEWIRKELEFSLGTVVVSEWKEKEAPKKTAPKKMSSTTTKKTTTKKPSTKKKASTKKTSEGKKASA